MDEAPGLLKDLVGAQDLADLMDARQTPATHASWPVKRSQGDPYMTIVCLIDGAGWNHFLRGSPAVLLPLECPGVAPPWRAGQIKERLGRLKIHHHHYTPFYEGIGAILSDVSATTCIYCGLPSLRPDTGLDTPDVRPMLGRRTAEPRAGESEPGTDRGSGQGSCAASEIVTIAIQ